MLLSEELIKEVVDQGKWFLTPQSTNITRFRYIKESKTLLIQFKGGQHYRYEQVPEAITINFMNSPSKGKFFLGQIKNSIKGIKCTENGSMPGTPNVSPFPNKI